MANYKLKDRRKQMCVNVGFVNLSVPVSPRFLCQEKWAPLGKNEQMPGIENGYRGLCSATNKCTGPEVLTVPSKENFRTQIASTGD